MNTTAEAIEAVLAREGVQFTLGGEPTYVPLSPEGEEWSVSAVGPTKLDYARRMAEQLIAGPLAGALPFFTPGKLYPGELNPRWALHLLWSRDGEPVLRKIGKPRQATARHAELLRRELILRLKLHDAWMPARCPRAPRRNIHVLPVDYEDGKWHTDDWEPRTRKRLPLLNADGPAGLRLPLAELGKDKLRRALTLELEQGVMHVFLPPLLAAPFRELLTTIIRLVDGKYAVHFSGYPPAGVDEFYNKITLAADPGVLEINLPPCDDWRTYDIWLHHLEHAAHAVGLRSHKRGFTGFDAGTGGGNHLIFGGPTLDSNPFFSRPRWVAAILRYWQKHPCLAYLFTGIYVGSSSQAPRPDESARDLLDLEMGYRFLETLPPGDQRVNIANTLRHLHIDLTGNTHRSEISFDKFWTPDSPAGCAGLIEFRAIETMPHAAWMSAIALLWRAIATMLLLRENSAPLENFGTQLHDRFFIPAFLWQDLEDVFTDLQAEGWAMPREIFRAIFDWRFPKLLETDDGLVVRRALEGWPLLSETPIAGGNTSRFVDTSMERLEISFPKSSAFKLFINDRSLPLRPLPEDRVGIAIRYRNSALHPCLHPGIPPQLPLRLHVAGDGGGARSFQLDVGAITFRPISGKLRAHTPAHLSHPEGFVIDLRVD